MRDTETIDSEMRLVAALRRAARERGGPLPSIDVAGVLLDKRREWTERVTTLPRGLMLRGSPRRSQSAWKVIATPFMQYRRPVGGGPSLNTWPRWPPHRLHRTSVRIMPRLVSERSSTEMSMAFQKLGHPVPLSNLVSEE